MKKPLLTVTLFCTLFWGGCGIFGGSDEDPTELSLELDKEVLSPGTAIIITAVNPTSDIINLQISRTGDPHLEKRIDGVWTRTEETPPQFWISTLALEPGEMRSREISYSFINQVTGNPTGEYRVYYNYHLGEDDETTYIQHSDSFMVE